MQTRKLDLLVNLVMLLTCIVLLASSGASLFSRSQPGHPSQIQIGTSMAPLLEQFPDSRFPALVLAVSPDCRFCQASLPFYGRLLEARKAAGSSLPVFAVVGTVERVERQQAQFQQHQVAVDAVLAANFLELGIFGVPAILLIDEEGVVQQAWQGQLDERREREVLDVL